MHFTYKPDLTIHIHVHEIVANRFKCVSFQVCENGFIVFDDPYYSNWPEDVEYIYDRTILAAYFADMDIRDSHGTLYYHAYDENSDVLFPSSYGAQQAKLYIKDIMGNDNFKIKYLFVATWFQARKSRSAEWWYYDYGREETKEVCALIGNKNNKGTFVVHLNVPREPWWTIHESTAANPSN